MAIKIYRIFKFFFEELEVGKSGGKYFINFKLIIKINDLIIIL